MGWSRLIATFASFASFAINPRNLTQKTQETLETLGEFFFRFNSIATFASFASFAINPRNVTLETQETQWKAIQIHSINLMFPGGIMLPDGIKDEIVRRLVPLDPEKVILFGSYA